MSAGFTCAMDAPSVACDEESYVCSSGGWADAEEDVAELFLSADESATDNGSNESYDGPIDCAGPESRANEKSNCVSSDEENASVSDEDAVPIA